MMMTMMMMATMVMNMIMIMLQKIGTNQCRKPGHLDPIPSLWKGRMQTGFVVKFHSLSSYQLIKVEWTINHWHYCQFWRQRLHENGGTTSADHSRNLLTEQNIGQIIWGNCTINTSGSICVYVVLSVISSHVSSNGIQTFIQKEEKVKGQSEWWK